MAVAASTVGEASELLVELVWLVLLAAALAGAGAFLYRWYVREEIPAGLSLLVGLAGVTVYLNTSRALGQVIGGSTLPTEREVALFNIAAFVLATSGAVVGRRVGDRLGADVALRSDTRGTDREVGRLVETVGRVIAVELPEEIDDVVGYDPVPGETKETLAGRTFLFPRRLTVEELRERLVSRLMADYAVGTVDVDLAADGTVEYLALGSRAAGIGPTLPPETNAVAVRADPAFSASAGDLVQLWETDPPRRVLTAELRGVAEDVVTVAIDAADTTKVDPRTEYRLVTLPVSDRPDREFASLLRAAEETFSSVVVAAGSPLHGLPVGALDVAVVAVKPEDGQATALPERTRILAPGDRVFAIARAETLRRLETAAKPLDPSLVPGADRQQPPEPTPEPDSEGDPGPSPDQEETDASPVSTGEAESTDGAPPPEEKPRPQEPTASGSGGDSEGAIDGRADASSFQDLKAAFESGEADWAEVDGSPDDGGEPATADRETEARVDEEGETDDRGGEEVDDLAILEADEDDEADDLASLDVGGETGALDLAEDLDDEFGEPLAEEDTLEEVDPLEEDDLFGDDGLGEADENEEAGEETDDEETPDGDDENEDEDDAGDGGGKSFQELKEEFESGDADWADDVSDSPGGDMRLDE